MIQPFTQMLWGSPRQAVGTQGLRAGKRVPDTGDFLPRMKADRASSACVPLVNNPCLRATYAYIESGCACCMLLHCMAIFRGGS